MQYYALSGLDEFDSGTRGDALRACPWLLYSAPSALDLPVRPTFEAKSTTISDRFAHRCPESSVLAECSAKGAGYESQGQARSASPLVYAVRAIRPEGPE